VVGVSTCSESPHVLTAYHVNRTGRLRVGASLKPCDRTLDLCYGLWCRALENQTQLTAAWNAATLLLATGHRDQLRSVTTSLWEVLLEHVRHQVFPEKPSRLQANFLYPTIADAKRFRDEYRNPSSQFWGLIFECQVSECLIHQGDMALYTHTAIGWDRAPEAEINRLKEVCISYWKGDSVVWPEIVAVGGEVRATKLLEL